ncbi:MAG: hypothetical protein K8S54_07370 [Spirochaetia bacterium]|nr:hypothetical protein [Spirochaetia bacterium]
MKRILLLGLVVFAAQNLSATTYRLFVHGRSATNHCSGTIPNTSSATTDVGGYWSGWGYTPTGIANVRYIGFDGEQAGGAYSWSECGAQLELNRALNTFCTGANDCEIYTHSTGGLVVSAFFGLYPYTSSWYNIRRIQEMASAAGGSELADMAVTYLAWIGWSNYGGQLDHSVSTSGARNGFNHNQSGGLTLYTTSGQGSDPETYGITPAFLPGIDDGVVANHSLCGINQTGSVNVSCARGNGQLRESYACGFLWLSTCYTTWTRWTPYYTVWQGGSSETHKKAMADYNRR